MSTKITIRSPYDHTEIGHVDAHSSEDVNRAVQVSHEAVGRNPLPAWRRAEILYRCSELIGERREDLARTISMESAKPIKTARGEVARALSTMGFSSLEARRLGGEIVPMEGTISGEGKLAFTTRVPVGVVGAISPFNFPLNLVCHKVGPAIAAGCPVVLKPASQTPFSALALAELLTEAGLPQGWLSVITGNGSEVGNAIVEHPGINYVTFTGSAEVGWAIQQKAPKKRVGLELGSSTPVIIEPDSDWHKAAKGISVGGFSHAGQSCISVQRVYVHRSIASAFTDALVEHVTQLKLGDPLDENTDVSSLIDENSKTRVNEWVNEAISQGAKLHCGNEIDDNFLTPVVLSNVDLSMRVCKDEVFGPVVAIQAYDTLSEAIELANGTRFGLQAGIFTPNLNDALTASKELQFGGVIVNEIPTWRADAMPYGGVKESGNTREGPAYAIEHMTELRLTVLNTQE